MKRSSSQSQVDNQVNEITENPSMTIVIFIKPSLMNRIEIQGSNEMINQYNSLRLRKKSINISENLNNFPSRYHTKENNVQIT